jgi:hypothetical protein
MPHINQLKESRFLKKEDCGTGILVTICGCDQQNVAKEGVEPEMKWALHFEETEKPMVLNSTNAQIIAVIAKNEDTDNWKGVKVVLYNDPSISFSGKLTGGIRARQPVFKSKPSPLPPKATTPPEPEPESEPPF